MAQLSYYSKTDGANVIAGDEYPYPVEVRKPIVQEMALASGMEQVTVAGASVGLTTKTWVDSATCCLVYVETAPVRVRFDGSPATATVGILLNPGDCLTLLNTTEMGNFSAIRTTGTSGALTVLYATSPTALAQRPPIVRGFSTDSAGNVNTNANTLTTGEDATVGVVKVEQRFGYTNIIASAPTTTAIKSGAGFLHAVTYNKPVATQVTNLYDNTAASGTLIGTITIPASPMPCTYFYDVIFTTGLTVLTTNSACDITVSWR